MESTCIFTANYNRITVINQGLKTEYVRRVLNKIKKGLFDEINTMFKNGATNEEVWKFQNSETSRVYRLKKIRKAIKRTNAVLISSFKRLSLNFNRISSREYHSPTRRRASASTSNNTDSGDPDQPEPPSPPGLARLLTYPQISHTKKINPFYRGNQPRTVVHCLEVVRDD